MTTFSVTILSMEKIEIRPFYAGRDLYIFLPLGVPDRFSNFLSYSIWDKSNNWELKVIIFTITSGFLLAIEIMPSAVMRGGKEDLLTF